MECDTHFENTSFWLYIMGPNIRLRALFSNNLSLNFSLIYRYIHVCLCVRVCLCVFVFDFVFISEFVIASVFLFLLAFEFMFDLN